jgi:hypothetical protein
MRNLYAVIVGNVGCVCDTYDLVEARSVYRAYVMHSKEGVGRVSGEDVTLTANGEPIQEHMGHYDPSEPI